MKLLKLKPKNHLKIRNPETQEYLPEEGAFVERSLYWLRRIDEGAVELLNAEEEQLKEKY